MSINFIPSEIMFSNFINKYDIILDENYNFLKNNYNVLSHPVLHEPALDINKKGKDNDKDNSKDNFFMYFSLFNKYNYLKNEINMIYYIIVLYYFDIKNLLDFIRFYTVKLNSSKNLNNTKILNFSKIKEKTKIELIGYLKDNIDIDYNNFILFIYCIQNYI